MATIGSNVLTLVDAAKRMDPDGKTPVIAELLAQQNDVLTDMTWMEGNLPTGHRVTVRTGLPAVFWRLLNQGVQPSKSTTAQIDEGIGMLEAWSEVDKDLAELNGNVSSFRLSEAKAFIEAMGQEKSSTLFYGNSSVSPEEYNGFAVRYSSLAAENAENILDGGGTGSDNSSVWLVNWGGNTVTGIYPKGSKVGLDHEDMGLVTTEVTAGVAGLRMRAYQDRFVWKCGLSLKDWRHVVRIANVDISNLVAKSSAADLVELMIKAMHRIPNMGVGKPVFYVNRTVHQMLDIQKRDDVITGGGLTFENVDGKPVFAFRGIPVRRADALTETEARVI